MRVYIISHAIESVELIDISMTELNMAGSCNCSFFLKFILDFDLLTKLIQVIERGHERSMKGTDISVSKWLACMSELARYWIIYKSQDYSLSEDAKLKDPYTQAVNVRAYDCICTMKAYEKITRPWEYQKTVM